MSTRASALRLLVRLKFRGALRKQVRRLRTWRGLLFAVVGLLLFAGWIVALWVGRDAGIGRGAAVGVGSLAEQEGRVRVGLFLFTLLSIGGALQHRGLYLPEEEIERLFSAPLRRADLVRYRLMVNGLRALPGTLVLGLFAQRWVEDPVCGWLAIALAFQTLPVLNQLVAILLGKLESSWAKRLGRLARPLMMVVAAGLGVAVFLGLSGRFGLVEDGGAFGLAELYAHPAFRAVTAPAVPYWKLMSTPGPERFAWLAVAVAVWGGLSFVTVRLPIDFRELSLETAASVAQRIRRVRTGGSLWLRVDRRAGKPSRGLPFARGPMGAIAARKVLGIGRKSQGTLLVSVLVLAFVLVLSRVTVSDGEAGPLVPAVLVATVGALYLCSGLRFDFRDELARMESVLAWPVDRRRVFAATILPQVLLVSGLLGVAVVVQGAWFAGLDATVLAVLLLLPPFVFGWSALDNVVWLLSPVKSLPGQEGALVHAGRSILMVLLRGVFLVPLLLVVGIAVAAHQVLENFLDFSYAAAFGVATGLLLFFLVLLDLGWVWVGARCLGRFDLSRDRG